MSLHQENYKDALQRMLQKIYTEVEQTQNFTGISQLSSRVIRAFENVPRHLFVPSTEESKAYLNIPLPIGMGQTISQPFIVAIMTELLDIKPTDKILEIGTGSGYQAAILSQLAASVFTVEIIPSLRQSTTKKLEKFGYHTIHTKTGDGSNGWPEHAPYDKIIITAATRSVPPALIEQLTTQGCIIIPLGQAIGWQVLTVIKKEISGQLTFQSLFRVVFVPLL